MIVAEGTRYLGSGERQFVHFYLQQKVADWVEELDHLTEVASMEPRASKYYAALRGLQGRWNYILRTLCAGRSRRPRQNGL